MKTNLPGLVVSIFVLALAMLACGVFSPKVAVAPVSQNSQPPIATDDFSNENSGWQTEASSDDVIEYADGGLRIKDWSSEWLAWTSFGDKFYKDVHIDVTVKNTTQKDGFSFGVFCDLQKSGSNAFYSFVITGSGEYSIGKSLNANDFKFLTNNNDWGTSNLIAKNAASYRMGVDCAHGNLALYVDGNKIAFATDSTFSEGRVALSLWSGESSAGPVTFDDFVMTSLE